MKMLMIALFFLSLLFVNTNAFIKHRPRYIKRFQLRDTHLLDQDIDLYELYTLIWHECRECKVLLQDMENLDLPFVYIDGGDMFYDLDVDNEPLFYKNEYLIGTTLFDIYAEIYKNV